MPRGHRHMYYATGMPGWMRFGYSPGWAGMSPYGLGPGATYLMTGQWPTPQAQAYWQAMQTGQASYPSYGGIWGMPSYGSSAPSSEQEMELLRNQAQIMGEQLERIQKRLQELEGEE